MHIREAAASTTSVLCHMLQQLCTNSASTAAFPCPLFGLPARYDCLKGATAIVHVAGYHVPAPQVALICCSSKRFETQGYIWFVWLSVGAAFVGGMGQPCSHILGCMQQIVVQQTGAKQVSPSAEVLMLTDRLKCTRCTSVAAVHSTLHYLRPQCITQILAVLHLPC